MSEELTYAERVQKLRTSLDKATARKEEKEETRKNLIKDFDNLKVNHNLNTKVYSSHSFFSFLKLCCGLLSF
jgi:superoxide dismutase